MDPYAQWEGQIVPSYFDGGLVFLSYAISYVGSWTTLELLDRRTAGRGRYNWYLLIGSSLTMGAIALWCTHFIGNRALVLGNGAPEIQLAYSSGFTALSFFVPIVVLLAAFFAIGSNEKVRQIRVILGGAMAGLAICAVFYLGQAGIANYDCVYNFQNMVGSIIIAIMVSIISLWIFFVLRAGWTNSWWKRALCAFLLSGAVSGMNWLAAAGTSYRFKSAKATEDAALSRNHVVVVVIVLAVVGCSLLLILAIMAQHRRKQSANRAQQVVLACATFDSHGRLLVTSEGLLPSQKITNSYIERSFDDIFNISHPVFLWIFRTSRNWRGITDLIPGMRSHLNAAAAAKSGFRPGEDMSAIAHSNEDQGTEDYSIIFRELFCVAASELADQINEPLENVGVLYDEIMSTGVTQKRARKTSNSLFPNDLERANPTPLVFGKGQVLFVVRRTSKAEAARLQASGFRFAGAQNVVDILARSMQVNRDALAIHIEAMQRYSRGDHILNPGVHLGCFAIRASVKGGFDVLVRRDAKNQLPTMQLPVTSLEPWQRDVVAQFSSWTVAACLKYLRNKSAFTNSAEQLFCNQLYDTIAALADEVSDSFFNDAQLVTRPIFAPCRGFGDYPMPGKATLLAFQIIVPIHSRAPNSRLIYSPLSFFRTQQHVYRNMPDHDVFARAIHREFGPIVGSKRPPSYRTTSIRSPSPTSPRSPSSPVSLAPTAYAVPTLYGTDRRPELANQKSWFGLSPSASYRREKTPSSFSVPRTPVPLDSSSEKHLIDPQVSASVFGGIMVSQEVSVDVREVSKAEAGVEMSAMGTFGSAATEVEDCDTFVDALFSEAVEGR